MRAPQSSLPPWNSHHTNPSGGLANYYRNDVIGGPGAFVMAAENFNSFAKLTAPAQAELISALASWARFC
jgi:hypothetical protein